MLGRERPANSGYAIGDSTRKWADDIIDWVRSASYGVDRISDYHRWYQLFGEKLKQLGETERQRSPLPILYQWKEPITVANQPWFSVDQFAKVAGPLPLITESFVH